MNRVIVLAAFLGLVLVVVAGVWVVGRPVLSPPEAAGVSATLARDRASRVSGLRYEIALRLPANRQEAVRGEITATFDLAHASRSLAFDFAQPTDRLISVTANGQPIAPAIVDGHIVIPTAHLVRGQNQIHFQFVAGDAALNRQEEFLYSLFVPARASLTFPCFDQPDLKARWRLSLETPAAWVAVSNGRQAGRTVSGDRASYLFEETPPISTYLFAFAAGRFQVETAVRDGRTFRMFHREPDPSRLARNREAIFDLHARALAWLEDYTGVAYPFAKFDFALIPSFQFGGMEHPGAIFYNANSLLLDEAATEQQYLSRANVVSHETSHMWFGDLVTMSWFDDVWMKEVFANFMAAKIVNPSFPAINHELRFFLQHYPVAYEVDRTPGANPIRQDLANLSDAGSLYGAVIYQKAPVVMRQLERLVGEDIFKQGLRDYLTLHGFSNASWPDLVNILDAKTPVDLAGWSRSWVTEAGRPTISTIVESSDGRLTRVALRQSDPRGRSLLWTQQIRVAIGHGADVRYVDVTLDRPEVEVPELAGQPLPDWILPAAGGLGYGSFELDAGSRNFLAQHAQSIADPVTRGAAFVTLWDGMLEGSVAPDVMRAFLLSALPAETVELNLQQLLDETRAMFWRFTSAADRPAMTGVLEPLLRQGLERAKTTSAKAAWFGALRGISTTEANLKWLEDVWAHRRSIPGLPLAEVDESDLAMDLAVRDVPAAEAILKAQLERIANPDRKARFAFIMPALSREASVRTSFFESLKDVKNRSREAWVLDAARYLHHPLRAGTSAPFVRPALELVREIQRTGDIFFPKRWADATLAGYQSPEVAADVRAVIAGLPADYPPRLRWVLLSAADQLFRAADLVK